MSKESDVVDLVSCQRCCCGCHDVTSQRVAGSRGGGGRAIHLHLTHVTLRRVVVSLPRDSSLEAAVLQCFLHRAEEYKRAGSLNQCYTSPL